MTDGHVMAMTLAERGAYITLLCLCWMDGGVPSDLSALARRCHVSTPVFTKLWPALEPCFVPMAGEMLIQPRIERERKKQETYRAIKAEAGRLGGRPLKAEVISCLSTDEAEVKQNESRDEAKESPPSSSSSSSSTPVRTNTDLGNLHGTTFAKIDEHENRRRRAFR
jgi:uncharacterized protein YdaU (DUF1376 family)